MQRRMHSARDQRSEGHRRATCQRSPARTRDQGPAAPAQKSAHDARRMHPRCESPVGPDLSHLLNDIIYIIANELNTRPTR